VATVSNNDARCVARVLNRTAIMRRVANDRNVACRNANVAERVLIRSRDVVERSGTRGVTLMPAASRLVDTGFRVPSARGR